MASGVSQLAMFDDTGGYISINWSQSVSQNHSINNFEPIHLHSYHGQSLDQNDLLLLGWLFSIYSKNTERLFPSHPLIIWTTLYLVIPKKYLPLHHGLPHGRPHDAHGRPHGHFVQQPTMAHGLYSINSACVKACQVLVRVRLERLSSEGSWAFGGAKRG